MTKQTDGIPHCIGIIMDGNRRWAKEHDLPTLEGHRRGYDKIKEVVGWAKESGVKNIIVYAFSTENWQRTEEEVSYLMNLLQTGLATDRKYFKEHDVRVSVIGQQDRLSSEIQQEIEKIEQDTQGLTSVHLTLAISYGGRTEIIDGINQLLVDGKTSTTEDDFRQYLWTRDLPDPDLIIRTSGEKRLSNFLTWQSVYSELLFIEKHWPDFSQEDFKNALVEFSQRTRRRGK